MSKNKITGKVLTVQLGREETQLVLVGKDSEILHGMRVPTPAGAVEDGMIQDQEAVTGLLKTALETPEFKGVHQVVFVLCTSQVVMETATTPDLPKAKLEKLIQANADMYFPMDIRDYRLVWEVIGPKKNNNGTKEVAVQLWAVPMEMVKRCYQAANACGLSVAAVDYVGHSAAAAVGATFSRPVKSTKAAKAPKEPKEKKKIDWNAEITFGKKKKVEPEPEEEAEAGPRTVPETQLHILADADLLGMTFVQEGQVVSQKFYQNSGDPAGEVAMLVDYFSATEQGRGSEIRAFLSGAGCEDGTLAEELSAMLGISVESSGTSDAQRWALCVSAAHTALEFGDPSLNNVHRARRQINSQLWQYAAILAAGILLIAVGLFTMNARLGWDSELASLQSQYNVLSAQAAKVNGFKANYDEYQEAYSAYDRDWDALFDSLHTYNDNLVFVLEELEKVMPENTSVTDIVIDSDNVTISFACDDKEEAAYLIMSLRDMEYVDVNTITNLVGGGKGPATEYGTPIEDVAPPTEGGSLEYDPTLETLEKLEEKYGTIPAISDVTLNQLKEQIGDADRVAILMAMVNTDPFVMSEFVEQLMWVSELLEKEIEQPTTYSEALKLANDNQAMLEERFVDAERLIISDSDLKQTYIHYLEYAAPKLLDGQIESIFADYHPYIDEEKREDLKADPSEEAVWLKDWICTHENATVKPSEAGDAHDYTCSDCGKTWSVSGTCVDNDLDEVCDTEGCGATVCSHSEEKHQYTYTRNEDGITHKVTCGCETLISDNVPCEDSNHDCVCDDCGEFLEHVGTTHTEQYGDKQHKVICDGCGVELETVFCEDGDEKDLTCECGNIIDHEHQYECTPNDNGTHKRDCTVEGCPAEDTVACEFENDTCKDCGFTCAHDETYESITMEDGQPGHKIFCLCGMINKQEYCIDVAPEDQICDVCGGDVPEPVAISPTRLDIEALEKVYGQVPTPEYKGDLNSFLKEYSPTDYEREAAIINLLEKNAFAANRVIEQNGAMISALTGLTIAEDEPFETVELAIATFKQKLMTNLAYLPVIENSLSEDDTLEQIYIYYLERAMSDDPTSNPLPHLNDDPAEGSVVTPRIEQTLEYVRKINGGDLMEPRIPPFETLMVQYLLDDTSNIDSEILAQLEKYFNDEEVSEEFKSDFKLAVAKTNSTYLDVPELLKEEFYSQYYHGVSLGYKNLTKLYNNYRKDLIEANTELLLVLKQSEQAAENAKDLEQDKTLAKHEQDIADLKKQLESLKKAAASEAEEEAGASGGGSGSVDTRVFLDIGLLYTEELWDQELQRKGLNREDKLPKLELEVG